MSASTIVVFFGVSEVLSYQQAAEFFTQHEMRIQQGGENEALLAAFRQEKQSLLWELAALRLLSVVGAVAALSVALNWLWGRLVSRPINLLLDRMQLDEPGYVDSADPGRAARRDRQARRGVQSPGSQTDIRGPPIRCCLKTGSHGAHRATSHSTNQHRQKPSRGDPGVAVRGAVSQPGRASGRSAPDGEGR